MKSPTFRNVIPHFYLIEFKVMFIATYHHQEEKKQVQSISISVEVFSEMGLSRNSLQMKQTTALQYIRIKKITPKTSSNKLDQVTSSLYPI